MYYLRSKKQETIMHDRKTRLLIGALACMAVTACGGGGGGGGSSATPTTPSSGTETTTPPSAQVSGDTPIAITSANAAQTAGLGHLVIANAVSLGGQTTTLVGAETTPGAAMNPPGLLAISFQMLDAAIQASAKASADVATGATELHVGRCAQSGSSSRMVVAKSFDAINIGDQITLEYKDCVEGGVTRNGRVDIAIEEVSASGSTDQAIKASLTFAKFKTVYDTASGMAFDGKVQAYKHGQTSLMSGWVKSDNVLIDYLRNTKSGSMKLSALNIDFESASNGKQYSIAGNVSADFPTVKGKLNIATSQKLLQTQDGVLADGRIRFSGTTGRQNLNYGSAYRQNPPDLEVQSDFNDDGSTDQSESVTIATLVDRLW